MFRSVPHIATSIISLTVFTVNAQVLHSDSLVRLQLKQLTDSIGKPLHKLPDSITGTVKKSVISTLANLSKIEEPNIKQLLPKLPFQKKQTPPLIAFTGGYLAYTMAYRDIVDTPFAQKNVYQHNFTGRMGLTVAGIPLQTYYLIRRTNAISFQQITDVQVSFDVQQYQAKILQQAKQQLLQKAAALKDPLLELDFNLQQQLADISGKWLQDPMNQQRLIESYEIISLPPVSEVDSTSRLFTDSIKKAAASYIQLYKEKQQLYEVHKARFDSIATQYQQMLTGIQTYKTIVEKGFSGITDPEKIQQQLSRLGITEKILPKKFAWLLGIKKFAIGRSILNQSPLTAQNINLTGINIAYSYKKWYIAATAGTVDYRFRDFVSGRTNRTPQYIYLAKVGVGKEEGTHFFVSVFRGQKQLFTVTNTERQPTSMVITGVSAEVKYRLNKHHYIIAEVAESVSPDFRSNPVVNQKFNLNDRNNKAISLQFSSVFPRIRTTIEGMYRYTGANFQSFSNFQTNAAMRIWRIKLEQYFFGKVLKITAGARSNQFENPYLIQAYQSNTVLKNLQAGFKKRGWPMITVGYMPTTQLTRLDNQVLENQFNSLNASVLHTYKWFDRLFTTSIVYTQFYNTPADTNFTYFNATNLFINQTMGFEKFTMQVAVSHSKNSAFELNVLDGGWALQPMRWGVFGFGVKVSNFNHTETVTSIYTKLQVNLRKWGSLQAMYDNGYLPGGNKNFVKNTFFNIGYTRAW